MGRFLLPGLGQATTEYLSLNPVQATDPEDLASAKFHLSKINLFHSLGFPPADLTATASLLQELQELGRYCRDDLRVVTAKGDKSRIGRRKDVSWPEPGSREAPKPQAFPTWAPPGQHQEAPICPED